MPARSLLALLVVTLAVVMAAFASAAVYNYEYQYDYRYDGVCKIDPASGYALMSTSTNAEAVDFLKRYVVNGTDGNGSDEQVLAFRAKALRFFQARFGIAIPDNLPSDPAATITIAPDTVIYPGVLDAELDNHMLGFMHKSVGQGRFRNSTQTDGGYWVYVGPSGLPAGGTYAKQLYPYGSLSFGASVVQNVCPQISTSCRRCCKPGRRKDQGQLLLFSQSDMPSYETFDRAWSMPGSNLSASMIPIQLHVWHPEFKDGLCSGIFYAAPGDNRTTSQLSMLHDASCFWPPPAGYQRVAELSPFDPYHMPRWP